MKKIIYKILSIVFIFATFISCEQDDTLDISRVTYFNDIKMIGDELTLSPIGTVYQDQGVNAYEGDEDVTSRVITEDPVDSNTLGLYTVSYSITNADGFEKLATRTVIIHPIQDSGVDYSGVYTGDTRGEIIENGCTITKLGPSTYFASDFFGGVYCCGARDYGPVYVMPAYFVVNEDNTAFLELSNDSPWGPWFNINQAISGSTISHKVESSPGGFGFEVILIKQ